MHHKFVWVSFLMILLVGSFFRLFHLTFLPPSLNWDEVSHAYTAYSLYHTGRDQWGQPLPLLNFRAYGDYPAALNLYFTVPAIAALGPSDFAARLPHAIAGILVIAVVFIAGYRWTNNKYAALAAAFFVSLDPWILFPSRAIFQSNWVVLTLSLAVTYLPTTKIWTYVFLGSSLLAYHNTRIFIPLFTVALGLTSSKQRFAKIFLTVLSVVIISLPGSRARAAAVGLLDAGAVTHIEALRNSSSWPPLVARLVYNRPAYLIGKFVSNYLDYFSPGFLFIHGGTQYQFSLPGFGLLSLVQLPFWYGGLIILICRSRYKKLLIWLLLAPIPAALTQDRFAVIRATTMLPVVQIISSLAVAWLLAKLSRAPRSVMLLPLLVLGYFLQSGYLRTYWTKYSLNYSQSWQYGYFQLVSYLKSHIHEYGQIVITKHYGEPHEFLLWHWPWPPQAYQRDPLLVWDYHANWFWVDGFAKFRFVNDWELPQLSQGLPDNTLVVASPDNPTRQGARVTTINFLDGTPAFIISRI